MKFKSLLMVLCLGLFALTACISSSTRTPASVRGRHVIFTLHGVNGNEKSYAQFHPIIKSHLEKVDPGYEVIPVNFTYPVKQDNYDPNAITKDINARILKELGGHLEPTDKISVIGYSMGGQVMALWYLNTMTDPQNAQIAKQTTTLIGLASPYWGSNAAWLGGQRWGITDTLLKFTPASRAELESLTPLGKTTTQIREKMIAWSKSPELKAQFKPRIYSIAGIVPCQGKVHPEEPGCGGFRNSALVQTNEIIKDHLFAGLVRWESDLMVTIPSARFDFLYYQDGPEKPQEIFSNQFVDLQNQFSKTYFHVSETIHAGFENTPLKDVVIVEKSCWDPRQCQHSTYRYLFEALADCSREASTCQMTEYTELITQLFPKTPNPNDPPGVRELSNREYGRLQERQVLAEMQGFMLELSLKVPSNYQLPERLRVGNLFNYVRFHFRKPQSTNSNEAAQVITGKDVEFEIGRKEEQTSRMIKVLTDAQGNVSEIRVGLMGRFNGAPGVDLRDPQTRQTFVNQVWAGQELAFEVNFPGLQSRKINARVKPTTTTYVDLTLSK